MSKRKPKSEPVEQPVISSIEEAAADRLNRVFEECRKFFERHNAEDRDFELRYLIATEIVLAWWDVGLNRAVPRPDAIEPRIERLLGLSR